MRIAIVGGGFTGLSAAVELLEKGHEVVVFEAGERPGGLAVGFKDKNWKWSVEKFYHHIFANDDAIIALAKKVDAPILFKAPKTCVFREGRITQLDTPISLMTNSELSLWGRFRMAAGLGVLKVLNKELGMRLESKTAVGMLPELVGREGYEKVWRPLLVAKFGKFVGEVNMAWFWARIVKRTKRLGYFKGGFEELAWKCTRYIEGKGGEVRLNMKISEIKKSGRGNKVLVNGEEFDKAILTTPAPLIDSLIGEGQIKWPKINYLWGQTLVLEMERKLMDSYWLSILDSDFPFLVMVEHTEFMEKKHYGGKTLIYIGNYLADGDDRLKLENEELIDLYLPFVKQINPDFKRNWVLKSWKWQAPYAQPVFPVNYSKQVPGFKTKMEGVVVANMSMVYPWDRGTNYAVEMGQKVVDQLLCEM